MANLLQLVLVRQMGGHLRREKQMAAIGTEDELAAVHSRAGEIAGDGLAVLVQPQDKDQPTGLILTQKAARAPADDHHWQGVLISLHVDACPIASVALDVDGAAPHGVACGVAHAAVDDDGAGVHGVAHCILGVAEHLQDAAVEICA